MFMSTACLWLLTLQDVHNSVLKVCSLAFFEQFTGMLRNIKDPGPGKRETNGSENRKKCHRIWGFGTEKPDSCTTARSLFGTCSPTTNSPGVPTHRPRKNLSGLIFQLKLSAAELAQIHLFSMAHPLGRRPESISLNCLNCRLHVHRFVEVVTLNDSTVEQPLNNR